MGRSHSHEKKSNPSGRQHRSSEKWQIVPASPPWPLLGDWKFREIKAELWALGHYFVSLERDVLIVTDRARSRGEIEEEYEEEYGGFSPFALTLLQGQPELTQEVLPRLFRCSFLVSLWAVFESGTALCAEELRSANTTRLRLNDIRGDNFLDRAAKYFADVLGFQMLADQSVLPELKKLQTLRNAIAHGNGREGAVRDGLWRQIKGWSDELGSGVSTVGGNITLTKGFVRTLYQTVARALLSLVERTEHQFPGRDVLKPEVLDERAEAARKQVAKAVDKAIREALNPTGDLLK